MEAVETLTVVAILLVTGIVAFRFAQLQACDIRPLSAYLFRHAGWDAAARLETAGGREDTTWTGGEGAAARHSVGYMYDVPSMTFEVCVSVLADGSVIVSVFVTSCANAAPLPRYCVLLDVSVLVYTVRVSVRVMMVSVDLGGRANSSEQKAWTPARSFPG